MDGWKALVMVVAIVAVAGVALYVFDEIKKAKIQQAQAEAVGNIIKTGPNMVSNFIPGRR
jgi:hypothetical protein